MDPGTRKLTTDCIWCCLLQYYQGASYFKQASDKTTVNCDVTFIPSSLCFSSDWLRAAVSQLHSWFGLCGGYTDGRWISPIETSWLIQDTLGRAGLERWSGECEMFAKFKSISSPLHPPAPGPSFTSGPHYANWVQIPATATASSSWESDWWDDTVSGAQCPSVLCTFDAAYIVRQLRNTVEIKWICLIPLFNASRIYVYDRFPFSSDLISLFAVDILVSRYGAMFCYEWAGRGQRCSKQCD